MNEHAALVEWYHQRENWWTWRKTCPSVTLSTTNSTWSGHGLSCQKKGKHKQTTYNINIYMFTDKHCFSLHSAKKVYMHPTFYVYAQKMLQTEGMSMCKKVAVIFCNT